MPSIFYIIILIIANNYNTLLNKREYLQFYSEGLQHLTYLFFCEDIILETCFICSSSQ